MKKNTKAFNLGKANPLVSKKIRNKILRENGLEPHSNSDLVFKFIEGQEFFKKQWRQKIRDKEQASIAFCNAYGITHYVDGRRTYIRGASEVINRFLQRHGYNYCKTKRECWKANYCFNEGIYNVLSKYLKRMFSKHEQKEKVQT